MENTLKLWLHNLLAVLQVSCSLGVSYLLSRFHLKLWPPPVTACFWPGSRDPFTTSLPNFLAEEGNCNQTPTVVSETNTRPGYFDDSYQFIEFPASAVLTDGIKGERGSPSPNYWRGEEYKEAGFVLDLGCKSFLREIRVRRPSREE